MYEQAEISIQVLLDPLGTFSWIKSMHEWPPLAAEAIVVEQFDKETQNGTAEEAISSKTETKKTVAEQADPEHPCDMCDKSFGMV